MVGYRVVCFGACNDQSRIDGMSRTLHKLVTNESPSKHLIVKGLKKIKTFSWERCVTYNREVLA